MSLSLPADPPRARSLTGVVPQMMAALEGTATWFAPATSAIVFVVDGLGAHNLSARSGHARFLSSAGSKKDVARTVFPSTTASALTSLLTGVPPGEHGIVGYRALVPEMDDVVNQLRGWDTDGLDPGWQRAVPFTERFAAEGRPCFVVSKSEYAGTGFTHATMRGAQFVPSNDVAERVAIAADLAASHPGAFVYVYAPDLDAIGHKRGWNSDEWLAALEHVDGAARKLSDALAPGVGAVVTADHGMVDVPRHRHVLLDHGDDLVAGVRHIGGEPRMLHLYAEPGAADGVLARWRDAESARSWVFSREEATAAGLFGNIDPEVSPRIGDVLVAARSGIAYYDDRLEDKGAQRMVGQHGSLTNEERTVPLLRLGAFA
ncbi:Type I phosphodiesterase / nucleotide pyrophosphatase [Microbacterium sp. cf046]|uniref:alkaline phosphatase family protein n=1 Tax=Microbacterium sp. cf046 TaxID=1761803 RepID=UPI0008DFCE63|nr:nucleotide pyrophosphatase/phosphodiesterase family protein [Microbacterium sp. cf046]SFS05110.1 Type I phosphodiesterase / nucleotide pyrophosphatase [Microbacterium sp. cf046]